MQAIVLALFSLTLISCGGSSSGSNTTTTSTLSGTAAVGIPIDGDIIVTDSMGALATAEIDSTGNYVVDVTGLTPPFIIAAVPSDNMLPTQYSFAAQANITVNVTPLTTLTLFNASGQQDLDAIQADWVNQFASITQTQINNVQAVINANFAALFSGQGLDPATFDLFSSPFSANGTGFDAILDALTVTLDPANNTFSVNVDDLPFDFDFDIDIGDGGDPGNNGGNGAGADLMLAGADTSVIGTTYSTPGSSGFLTMEGISTNLWQDGVGRVLTMTYVDGVLSTVILVLVNSSNPDLVHSYSTGCGLQGADCSNISANFETGEIVFSGHSLSAATAQDNQATGPLTLTGSAFANVN